MRAITSPLAVLLCCTQCLPFSYAQQAPRPTYQSTQLNGDDRILHALNRFTFGPRPGDLDAVRTTSLDKWFEQQLHPASIDETDLNTRLAQFPEMQWTTEDLLYRLPSNAEIRQAMNSGRVPIPPNGTLHAIYENQLYRIQARKDAKAQKGAQPANAAEAGPQPNMQLASDGTMIPVPTSGTASTNPSMADPNTSIAADAANPEPEVDETSFRQILSLSPEDRVARLASMQPADFESFIKSLRPMQRIALNTGLTPQLKLTVAALENPERRVGEDLIAQRLTRDIYSNAQLQEVMTDFWLNHFNVYLRKNEQMPYYLVSYERDTIRPRSLGKFEDLLEAVAHSPAMLAYLDNAQSIGPDSPAAERAGMVAARRPDAKKKVHEGLNENYARELMELHTLGVNGGYTQADVTQVARVLTGWTIDRPLVGATFSFNPNRHEPGSKKVLGKKFKDDGEKEGRELLHMLATSPATAHFVCTKLAVRFVSDDPPPALVDRMAKSWLSSGGDIPAVLKTLFRSPELWTTSTYRAKVKTPLEFVVSAARAGDADIENALPLANNLRQMGMPVYGAIPPTGYDWKSSTWVSTSALVDRMNFALNLAANRLPGIAINWSQPPNQATTTPEPPSTPESEEARLEPLIIPGGANATTRTAALKQFQAQSAQDTTTVTPVSTTRRMNRTPNANAFERQDQILAGLLIGSPDFQRR